MSTSYNGWPASPDKHSIGVIPFGDRYGVPFPGGVRQGDPHTVLGYVASNFHHRVEAVVAGWLWGFNYRANVNNPSTLSCHASGTAIDLNAPNHPNGARGTFSSAQVKSIREILAEVQGSIRWGGDFTGTPDEMHFEIVVNASNLARVAATLPTGQPVPTPPPDEEDDLMRLTVQRANGVDYAHSPSRLITISSPDHYNLLLSNRWIDVPHGEAEVVNRDLIEWTAGQVVAGGGVADPLL